MSETTKAIPGIAALAICESTLIALTDLGILSGKQERELLEVAVERHRTAAARDPEYADMHWRTAAEIQRIIDRRKSAWIAISTPSRTPALADGSSGAGDRDRLIGGLFPTDSACVRPRAPVKFSSPASIHERAAGNFWARGSPDRRRPFFAHALSNPGPLERHHGRPRIKILAVGATDGTAPMTRNMPVVISARGQTQPRQ